MVFEIRRACFSAAVGHKKANDIAMTACSEKEEGKRGSMIGFVNDAVAVGGRKLMALKLKVRMRFYLLRRNLNCKSCTRVKPRAVSFTIRFSSFFPPIERRQILNVIIGDIFVFQTRMF